MLDTAEFEENNIILLRKANFAFMIPNPSLDCSYVVLNFWANLNPVVLTKKKRVYFKALLHCAIFSASCLAMPLRDKLLENCRV